MLEEKKQTWSKKTKQNVVDPLVSKWIDTVETLRHLPELGVYLNGLNHVSIQTVTFWHWKQNLNSKRKHTHKMFH